MKEFQEVDTNRDGSISREELRNFFMSKGITNELQLNAVVDDLFEMLD